MLDQYLTRGSCRNRSDLALRRSQSILVEEMGSDDSFYILVGCWHEGRSQRMSDKTFMLIVMVTLPIMIPLLLFFAYLDWGSNWVVLDIIAIGLAVWLASRVWKRHRG